MSSLRRITAMPLVQKCVGVCAAEYLRLVRLTSSFQVDPADAYDRIMPDLPVIFAMWHGHQLMAPFFKHERWRVRSLVSRHRDGEIIAVAAERLGIETIRGSGTHGGDFRRKGGMIGFRHMLKALAQGYCIALTADVPKVARVAGRGIVELARMSGRPIYPVVPATSHRIQLNNWDRAAVNLPFSRFVVAVGEPIRIAADANAEIVEQQRQTLEAALNSTFARAYAIIDGAGKKARNEAKRAV